MSFNKGFTDTKEIIFPQKINEPVVLCMGFFDCVHMGHRALIDEAKRIAGTKYKTAIITFSNNPYKIFNYESKLICTYSERIEIFNNLKIDYCLPFKFDAFFKEIPHTEFLEQIFSNVNVKAIVCGYDYLFGAKGEGDTVFLQKECDKKGIELKIIPPVLYNGERVSSTLIKETLENGDIEKANKMLIAPYSMTGEVVKGRGVGHLQVVPTINLSIHKDKMLPKFGVYLTNTHIGETVKRSVTNIGAKPTFDEPVISIETFIENEGRDLYGKTVRIEFIKFLREIKKFESPQKLKEQIESDIHNKIN